MPELTLPPDMQTDPLDVVAWGQGSTYEELLLLRTVDSLPEDEYMTQTVINTSVLHRRAQQLLLESERLMTETKYSGVHACGNVLTGILWMAKELKYFTEADLKQYRDKLIEFRQAATLYEQNGL